MAFQRQRKTKNTIPQLRPSQINHLFNVTNPPQICYFFKNKQTGHVITDWQHLIGQKISYLP